MVSYPYQKDETAKSLTLSDGDWQRREDGVPHTTVRRIQEPVPPVGGSAVPCRHDWVYLRHVSFDDLYYCRRCLAYRRVGAPDQTGRALRDVRREHGGA